MDELRCKMRLIMSHWRRGLPGVSDQKEVISFFLRQRQVCGIDCLWYKMFNVSALLLDDSLLKCVVTEVVLFSIVAFKTLTFHNVVCSAATHLRCRDISIDNIIKHVLLILTVKQV